MKTLRKFLSATFLVFIFMICNTMSAIAAPMPSLNYEVKSGDSLWKICVKYEIGCSEILQINPQISNPDLIYPGQLVKVPDMSGIKSFEDEVARLVNIERSKQGLPSLKLNWQLSRVARYKSQDMINKNYFSHTSPTFGDPFKMIKDFGINYRTAGENIAYGQNSAQEVMNGWMNSQGHRSNILNSNFSQIGVGLSIDQSGRKYWTQMFIGW
ncbi:CAP domain-containing protein [Clostridium sp. DL1XJH146]